MHSLDSEVRKLLRVVFDKVTARLPDDQPGQRMKAAIAARLLSLAAAGERDPTVLRTAAESYCRDRYADVA
jgi:hypothetical protein